jgi:hypothetical protein
VLVLKKTGERLIMNKTMEERRKEIQRRKWGQLRDTEKEKT